MQGRVEDGAARIRKEPNYLFELLIQPALQVADEANDVDQGVWVHESFGALVPAMFFQLSKDLNTSISTRKDVNDGQQTGSEPNPG